MEIRKDEIKRIINKLIRQNSRFPTLLDICNALSYNQKQARNCMEALAEDGYLERKGDWYSYPENFRPDDDKKHEHIVEETVEKEEQTDGHIDEKSYSVSDLAYKHEKPKRGRPSGSRTTRKVKVENDSIDIPVVKSDDKIKENITLYGVPIYIVQICMGIIGIGASIISVYYTTVWLIEFLPFGFALLLSSIMIGFSVSAFETIILFFSGQVTKSKIAKITISIGFIVLWLVVSFFSVMSTVAGQYNKHIANIKEQAKSGVNSGKASWSLLQERKQDIQKRIDEYRNEAKTFNKLISNMSDVKTRSENTNVWLETQYRLQETNRQITKLNDDLNKIRDMEQLQIEESKKSGTILSSTSNIDIPNFYGWIAGILSVDSDKVQFWMSLFPAVFVDFIAPIGIALSLFLRNKYKKI